MVNKSLTNSNRFYAELFDWQLIFDKLRFILFLGDSVFGKNVHLNFFSIRSIVVVTLYWMNLLLLIAGQL